MGIESIVEGDCGIVVDARHFPVVVATWYGDPSEAVAERYFAWQQRIIERTLDEGTRYVLVTDATFAKRPRPSVRQKIAELTDALPEVVSEINVGNYVVVESALVRGALTAMQWLSRSTWTTRNVASCEEALRLGLADLDRAGVRRPAGLDPATYVRPALQAS